MNVIIVLTPPLEEAVEVVPSFILQISLSQSMVKFPLIAN